MTDTIDSLVADALHEIQKAKKQAWRLPDGTDASTQLSTLEHTLFAIRDDHHTSRQGLARWVADWIPDLNNPLIGIVSRLEHLAPPA